MAPNNKRREATRRQLEQQLRDRQQREARRRQAVLIGSIAGTVVIIAVVIVLVAVLNHGSSTPAADKTTPAATTSASPTVSASASASSFPTDTPCKVTHPAGSVVFDDVTIANPTNLTKTPDASSCSKTVPTALAYKDLVVGKGTAPSASSTVSVQYEGVFYSDGYQFNSSWRDNKGQPTSFSLAEVVKGFTYGIAGQGKIPPMKVGGRRVVVLPASLAYGSQASNGIPADTPLVFVIDLKSVTAG